MKKLISSLLVIALIGIAFSSCTKHNDSTDPNALIDPSDANALSRAISILTSTRVSGIMPSPTGGVQTPVVTSLISNVITSNGATAPFLYTYNNAISNLGGFYVQIAGSNTYFNVPYTGTASATGQVNLPLILPANTDSGYFCLLFSVYDVSGHVSNQVRVCANVLRLGTGSLQVSLSWNTATDQDLWVTDPSGTKIYYNNKVSSTGGRLDRDDIDGYGPENIFWLANAPDGEYKVQVNDYRNTSPANTCYVTITAPGKTKSFTVTTQNHSVANVVTIIKNGSTYDF